MRGRRRAKQFVNGSCQSIKIFKEKWIRKIISHDFDEIKLTKLSHRIIEANLKSRDSGFSVDGLHSFLTLTFTIVLSNE